VTAPEARYDAFLCYARGDDEALVKRLRDDLASCGLRIWWDRADMQSQALTFLQVIRDHIDQSERLIAIVGPAALASDYVRAEWEHARLFAKGVIDIPRLSPYEDIPQDVARFHGPDFRQDAYYGHALNELVRLLREPLAPIGMLTGVPALPAYFVPPVVDLEALRDLVLAVIRRPVTLPSAERLFSIVGMPGSGKSVLAAAFARSSGTRRAFHDSGIVWARVGQHPRLVEVARAIAAAFDEEVGRNAAIAFANLQRLLEHRACLIVLDDV
jgi:hypothetical protein